MSHERSRCGSAVDDLEHRRLQFEVVATVEVLPQGAHDGGSGAYHVTGGRTGQQVELAVTHPIVLAQRHRFAGLVGPRFGDRAQRLGGDAPGRGGDGVVSQLCQSRRIGAVDQAGLGEDAQLAAARGDDAAAHEEVVAQVDVGLEGGQGRMTDPGQGLGRQHGLKGGAGAVGEGSEAEPAGAAQEDHAPGQTHDVPRLLAGPEMAVALAHGGDGRGDGQLNGVGVPTLGAQALALGGADVELLSGTRVLPRPPRPAPLRSRGGGLSGVGVGKGVLLGRVVSHARESSDLPSSAPAGRKTPTTRPATRPRTLRCAPRRGSGPRGADPGGGRRRSRPAPARARLPAPRCGCARRRRRRAADRCVRCRRRAGSSR